MRVASVWLRCNFCVTSCGFTYNSINTSTVVGGFVINEVSFHGGFVKKSYYFRGGFVETPINRELLNHGN